MMQKEKLNSHLNNVGDRRPRSHLRPSLWDFRSSFWALRTRKDSSALVAVIRDAIGKNYSVGNNPEHLTASMDWLCAAQDATECGGVSAFYDVREGIWGPAYPETTGYIIPTFFDYAKFIKDKSFGERAIQMADWLLTLQLDQGAFPLGPLWPDWERIPIVFDTGQIIFGLTRTFEETGHESYLSAAQRAGDWLVEIQEDNGSWQRHTSLNHLHIYNVRTAWALLRIDEVSQDTKYRQAAVKNVEWALQQQKPNGWFEHMWFRPSEDPLTHTIAYTIRGILESGLLLSNQEMISAAKHAADMLLEKQTKEGFLRARFGPGWQSQTDWSCPTGTAQMAIIWFKYYELTGEQVYLEAAHSANHFLKQIHNRNAGLPGVTGGIPGSFPIYGEYEPYRNLNWAVKFFVESLLFEERMWNPKAEVEEKLVAPKL